MSMTIKNYRELITLPTFEERFLYLKLDGCVGEDTFGWMRYLNQKFYSSVEWKKLRRDLILRDNCCDLGVDGYEIFGRVYIHHIMPLKKEDVINNANCLWNPDNLIITTLETHNAIHYGDESILNKNIITERKPNDTCPWKNAQHNLQVLLWKIILQ